MERPRILVFAADARTAQILDSGLRTDFEVCLERNRDRVVTTFRDLRPSLIVYDLECTRNEVALRARLDTIRDCRRVDPAVPIVVIGTVKTRENIVRAVKFGASDYVMHPIDVDELRLLARRLQYLRTLEEMATEHGQLCSDVELLQRYQARRFSAPEAALRNRIDNTVTWAVKRAGGLVLSGPQRTRVVSRALHRLEEVAVEAIPDARLATAYIYKVVVAEVARIPLVREVADRHHDVARLSALWRRWHEYVVEHHGVADPDDPTASLILLPEPSVVSTSAWSRMINAIAHDSSRLYELNWREFEDLVGHLLAKFGWQVSPLGRTRDGGLDVVAVKSVQPDVPFRMMVQCKRYAVERRVGVELVREVWAVKWHRGYSQAMIATTSFFTKGARETAQKWDLELRDHVAIVDWCKAYGTPLETE